MRVLIDACVLFPTVMREMVVGAAAAGGFQPLWSARILEEWARATRRLPEGAEAVARGEIALLRAAWPEAEVAVDAALVARLSLPDPDDRHVLAAAIAGGAEVLLTLNRADFPDPDAGAARDRAARAGRVLSELLAEGVGHARGGGGGAGAGGAGLGAAAAGAGAAQAGRAAAAGEGAGLSAHGGVHVA